MYLSHYSKNALKLVLVLLISLACILVNAEDDQIPSLRQQTVILDSNTQVVAGLKTSLATPAEHYAEFEAIGKVINIQPLLSLRERYLLAQADLNSAKAKQKQSQQSLKRQQILYRDGVTAKRTVQEQEALGSGDQALVDASQIRLQAIANETRLLWGKALAEWALSDKVKQLAAFLTGRKQLVQVTLPTNQRMENGVNTIFIEPTGQRTKAYSATLVSSANQVDNSQQGESYFFQASADTLKLGMKVTAWIPQSTPSQAGVIVPESAIIWHMGQVYAYIKVAKDTYSRRLIKQISTAPKGYFVQEDLKAGEELVITGAQMLLSEELRGQIPDED